MDKIDDTNGKINLYHEIIVNKAERDNAIISQMEQWSILSNVINYLQYNRHPKNFYGLDIRAVKQNITRKYIIRKRKDKYYS